MATVKISNVPGTGYFIDLQEGAESRLSGPFEREQAIGRLGDIGFGKDEIERMLTGAGADSDATVHDVTPAASAKFPSAKS